MKKLGTGIRTVRMGNRIEVFTQEEWNEVGLEDTKLKVVLIAAAVVFIINILTLIFL